MARSSSLNKRFVVRSFFQDAQAKCSVAMRIACTGSLNNHSIRKIRTSILYHVRTFPARTAKGSGTCRKSKEGDGRYSQVCCSLGFNEFDAPLALLEFANKKLQELLGALCRTVTPVF